ncbi:MAG: ribosome recycling factor [Synergistales bacterium]|nr:ribosome recycling factor [Synergistales bacterium]
MPKDAMKDLKDKMDKAVEHLRSEMAGVRTGRAHPALVEDIKVDYYGAPTPLKQLANISIPEARQILVSPWDPSAIKNVEKAILASPLGVTPQNDGEAIRINLPELTQERRKELTKVVRQYAEETKVAVRNLRREGNDLYKKMEKDSTISEDQMHDYLEEIQEVTDGYIEKIDEVLKDKEQEIMED